VYLLLDWMCLLDVSVVGLNVSLIGLDVFCRTGCILLDWMCLLLDWTCPGLDRMRLSVRLSAHNNKAFFDIFDLA